MGTGDLRLSLVVLAPVVGALLSYVLGRRAPKLAGVTASAAVLVSFLCSVLLWRAAGASGSFTATLSPWLSFGAFVTVAVMWLVPDRRIEKTLGK